MKPNRVVEAGRLDLGVEDTSAVNGERSVKQRHVGGIGQDFLMKFRVVRKRTARANPKMTHRPLDMAAQEALGIDGTDFHWPGGIEGIETLGLDLLQQGKEIVLTGKRFGSGHIGHGNLVFHALLGILKGTTHRKDRLAVLDRQHAAYRKALAIAQPIDLIDNGQSRVATTNEIGMEGMDASLDRLIGGGKRLGDDLTAKDPLALILRLTAAKKVALDRLEVEDGDDFLKERHECCVSAPLFAFATVRAIPVKHVLAHSASHQRAMSMAPSHRIVIAGGGNVGLALALALRRAAPEIGIILVDAAPRGTAAPDPRASALGLAATRMLDQLGIWQKLAEVSQPINEMAIGDRRIEDVGRPIFLSFAGESIEGEPLAHMVPNQALVDALLEACLEAGAEFLTPARVSNFHALSEGVKAKVTFSDGRPDTELEAELLIAADGARSKLRALAGISTIGWDYGQSGIVVTVEHERPHGGRARQDFLPAGPFAVLPLKGNRSSLVWTDKSEIAERLVRADPLVFRAELELRFGHELGWVHPLGPAKAFPLRLQLARSFFAKRLALCGDSAHLIHPIAGQGLNLGLQDAAALAEVLVDTARLGLDLGSEEALRRYQAWRRPDTVAMGLMTDGLNRLFSNRSAGLRLLRDIGLGLVDRLPGAKVMLIANAAGIGSDSPKLLSGRAI